MIVIDIDPKTDRVRFTLKPEGIEIEPTPKALRALGLNVESGPLPSAQPRRKAER